MIVVPQEDALAEGDWIDVSISHQIKIERDESWVKYGVLTKVQPGETSEDARIRAVGHVNESVMKTIDQTVQTVRDR